MDSPHLHEQKERMLADREAIRAGISQEALEVLKRRFGFDLPVFQRVDSQGATFTDAQFMNAALMRDGAREVICYILLCKK